MQAIRNNKICNLIFCNQIKWIIYIILSTECIKYAQHHRKDILFIYASFPLLKVSDAMSMLRLRFGEPVRFKFLVGMLNSYNSSTFQVSNWKLLRQLSSGKENIIFIWKLEDKDNFYFSNYFLKTFNSFQ